MIRVLQFADVINRYDFIDNIVQYADPTKFELSVCVRTENHNIAAPKFSEKTKYKLLPGNSRRDVVQTAWRLSRLLREWNIDVLHSHHFEQAIVGWLATRFYPKTRLIVGRHYSDSLYRLSKGVKQRGLLETEQLVNRAAARIIVPSKYIFEILTEKQKIEAEKIDVVLYGFVPEKYNVVAQAEIQKVRSEFEMDGRFVVGNFSRLHEEKGHRCLIQTAARLREKIPNLLILIVGEGAERSGLEKQIEELNLQKNVKLAGWWQDAVTLMAAVDAVAQPTLQEAFSQVMVEALWMAKPLVITDVSGAPDIIENGKNGLLVPKANVQSLSEAIEKLAIDSNLRNRLGENGRRFVEENLRIEKRVKDYENSYLRAIERMTGK